MKKILVTGGSGLVGRKLIAQLLQEGYDVAVLTRSEKTRAPFKTYLWNIEEKKIDPRALKNVDYVIHLAGANIGEKRWTSQRMKELRDSRIKSTMLLYEQFSKIDHKLKAFISASAIGYYGMNTTAELYSEEAAPANDFLGRLCFDWEQSADYFNNLGVRTVKIRTAIVLAKGEGALMKMLQPVKFGFGAAIGSGKQYMPWIHIDDLIDIYIRTLKDDSMKGAYNAVAPEHHTNKSFMGTIADVLKKPFFLPPIPGIIMKLLFGKMSAILLEGNRISSGKIQSEGFRFKFPELYLALMDLLQNDE